MGFIDEQDQAFVTLDFGQGPLDFQVDTAFRGTLMVGEEIFDANKASAVGFVEADLAGAQRYQFLCYQIQFEWLGQEIETHVLVGPGKECLLGTTLLNPHRLEVDYGTRTLQLIPNPSW